MLPKQNTILDLSQTRDQIGIEPDVYMFRRHFFAVRIPFTPWIMQLRMNKIMREDRDPNPHTHPGGFLSFILKGGYLERLYDRHGFAYKTVHRGRFALNWRPKDSVHNVISLDNNQPVTTLFLMFLNIKDEPYGDWGFIENGEYVSKRIYLSQESQQNRRTQGRQVTQ